MSEFSAINVEQEFSISFTLPHEPYMPQGPYKLQVRLNLQSNPDVGVRLFELKMAFPSPSPPPPSPPSCQSVSSATLPGTPYAIFTMRNPPVLSGSGGGTWADASGNRPDAILTGNGFQVVGETGENGAEGFVSSLQGTTADSIAFGDVVPTVFTICSVALSREHGEVVHSQFSDSRNDWDWRLR